jgi:hypothetical protein
MFRRNAFFLGIGVGSILLAVLVTGAWVFAQGSLTPPGPPGSSMVTLTQIYEAVNGGVAQRQGFCRSLDVEGITTQTLVTVPAGQEFVLLKLYASDAGGGAWRLTANSDLLLDGHITNKSLADRFGYIHDFPDRCVVVAGGKTLRIAGLLSSNTVHMTLIGYLRTQ